MLPNQEPIDLENYEYYRIHNFAEEFTARLGHDPFEGEEVGLNWDAQLHNVLYTIPESEPMYKAVVSLPPGASLVLPVTMGNLYASVGLLAPTHQIRVVAPGNVGDGSEQLPQEVLRRVTMESLFRKDPAQLKPGQNPLRFSAAGFLAKAEAFWASQKLLISKDYVPNMGAYTWPLAAQLLRGILMHMGETQKGFKDVDVLEWIRGHDATQLLRELNGSKSSFARGVLLPDENLERLASLREVLYRSLEWVNEYAEWKGENTGNPPIEAKSMDFQELRKGAAPTAALILVPKLGIDTPAWVGGVLGMVFSQAELELLGEQAGRPVVWVTTPETIAPGLTHLGSLLIEQPEHQERNTTFVVFLRKEELLLQKFGQEGWEAILNSVGIFVLNGGLRHRLASYVEKRLGNTVVNLRSESRSASMQGGMFPLPASASVSQSESVQPRYRAADLMGLVSSGIPLLVISTPELPASGQVLPIVDPNRWRKPTPTTPLDAIKLLQEQLNVGMPMPGNNLRITAHATLTNNQLATAQGQVGNLFPNSPPVRARLVEELNWGCIVCISLLLVLAYVVGHLLRWW